MSDEALSWNDLSHKVHTRRKNVQKLLRNSLSIAEIASLQNVSEMTIRRDLAWLEENQLSFTKNLKPSQRISESLSLFKEIEEKSMALCEVAMSREMIVDELDEKGRVVKVKKVIPDGHVASKHLQDAMKARISADAYIMKMGLLNESELDPVDSDISKMGNEELVKLIERSKEKILKLREDINLYELPAPFKALPEGWAKRLTGD